MALAIKKKSENLQILKRRPLKELTDGEKTEEIIDVTIEHNFKFLTKYVHQQVKCTLG